MLFSPGLDRDTLVARYAAGGRVTLVEAVSVLERVSARIARPRESPRHERSRRTLRRGDPHPPVRLDVCRPVHLPHLAVEPGAVEQVLVRAALDDAAPVQDEDLVHLREGGQVVGHEDGETTDPRTRALVSLLPH